MTTHGSMSSPLLGVVGRVHGTMVMGRRVRVLVQHLAALVPRGATVLDVGCGDGQIARALLARRPDLTLRGIDVLVRADTVIPVLPFDGRTIPLADGEVDVALLVDVLHHADDPPALLAEVARVTRAGVVVKDHVQEGALDRATLRAMDWVGNAAHGVRLPYNYLSTAQWHAAIARSGLRVDAWRDALGLYAPPASWLCDRRLHFVARLTR